MKRLILSLSAVTLFGFITHAADMKMFVAVEKFENKANVSESYFNTLRTRITDDIVNTRKFEVVERERIKSVMSEQTLKESGLTGNEEGDGPESGKMKSAGFVIYGSVLSLGRDTAIMSTGDVTAGKLTMKIELQLRLSNAETGKILSSKTIVATKSQARTQSAGMSASGNIEEQAIADVLREASRMVTAELIDLAFPTKILSVGKSNIKANLTKEQTDVDVLYDVFAIGEELEDPDSGESLGPDEELVGRFRVVRVAPKFATLEPVDDNFDLSELEKGMILRRVPEAELKKEKQKAKAKAVKKFESRF